MDLDGSGWMSKRYLKAALLHGACCVFVPHCGASSSLK